MHGIGLGGTGISAFEGVIVVLVRHAVICDISGFNQIFFLIYTYVDYINIKERKKEEEKKMGFKTRRKKISHPKFFPLFSLALS